MMSNILRPKMDENGVYVIEQPKHAILTIITIGDEFPLKKEIHDYILELKKISDIAFIFDTKDFSGQKNIDLDKFSILYGANFWLDTRKEDTLNQTIMRSLFYDANIFKSHSNFIFFDTWSELKPVSTDRLLEIASSNIGKPFINIKPYDENKLFGIYKLNKFLFNCFNTKVTNDNLFAKYYSESSLIFCKTNVISKFIDFLVNEDTFAVDYINTFVNLDFKYFLASLIKYLDIPCFDTTLDEINYGKVLTTRKK